MAESDDARPASTLSPSEIAFMLRRRKPYSVPAMMRELARLDRDEQLGRLRALSTLRPSERT
jgi:hypothetical protein